VDRPNAKPHLVRLPQVRAVTWNVYGTLLAISGGELLFEHPTKLIMDVALEKTIQEFKMWGSMSRKPGQPSEYMGHIYSTVLTEQRSFVPGEKHPEVGSDRVWEAILKKLLQKEYKFDAGFYGSLNELSRKIAYFFHASLQGTACYPGAAAALRHVREAGLEQGLLGEGQCFTPLQLQRGLAAQDAERTWRSWRPPELRSLSYECVRGSPRIGCSATTWRRLAAKGIEPGKCCIAGSRVALDLAAARRLGMKTALFAGDRASLQATPEQLKEPTSRPDVLLTG
jgi:hypothetical protein